MKKTETPSKSRRVGRYAPVSLSYTIVPDVSCHCTGCTHGTLFQLPTVFMLLLLLSLVWLQLNNQPITKCIRFYPSDKQCHHFDVSTVTQKGNSLLATTVGPTKQAYYSTSTVHCLLGIRPYALQPHFSYED